MHRISAEEVIMSTFKLSVLCVGATLLLTPAGAAADDASAEFPGQYAPPPSGLKYPAWAKGCARFSDPAERLACAEHVLGDWPWLGRYAAANAALPPPIRRERRVVFFGDSITDGWSRPRNGGFFPGKRYINRGISGQTTAQMLVRFRADVVALRPQAVVILAGTNDIAGNSGPTTPEAIQHNLAAMTDIARANRIKVVLASLLPVSDEKKDAQGKPLVRTAERPPEAIVALNRWIAEYARKMGHVFLDYHAALANEQGTLKNELNDDGVHPNAAGYAVMTKLAESAIARALR
jgi:lysophospholipase L1-like esterase